jgi:hypothetical protein
MEKKDVREVVAAAQARGAHVENASAEVRRLRFEGLLSNIYECVLVVRDGYVVDVRYDPTTW